MGALTLPDQPHTTEPASAHARAREGLPQRLRGEWASLTTNPDADLWRLRREAADEIDRLRSENEGMRQNFMI